MKWIINPFSGFLDAIGVGGSDGGNTPSTDRAQKVVDQNNVIVAQGASEELAIRQRIVFPSNAGVRIGYQSGEGLITVESDSNISIGDQAGNNPTSSSTGGNLSVGTQARKSSNGYYNTAFGFTAGRFHTGSNNAMIGQGAASYLIGNHNIIFGSSAGYYAQGSYNIYLGYGVAGQSARRDTEDHTLRIGYRPVFSESDDADDLIVGDLLNGGITFRGKATVTEDVSASDSGLTLVTKNYVDNNSGGGTVEGGGLTPVEIDLSITPNLNLENGKAYLIKPDENNYANNVVYLPAGEAKDKLLILDIDSKFSSCPVTVMGSVDGFTGLRMDVDHSWVEYYYHEGDSEWKTQDPYAGAESGSGGGYSAPEICDLDLSTDYYPTLEKNKIYLIKPDENNPMNNRVYLPSGSEGCSLTIIDSGMKFNEYPVTVFGNVDGFTGINMNVKHAWITFLYSTEDGEFKTQDPY